MCFGLILLCHLFLFAEGDQELARDQEFQDTPLDHGKPQHSGHEELELPFDHLEHLIWIFAFDLIVN